MTRRIFIAMAVAAAVIPAAHGQDTRRVHRLQDAMVWGRRPMKEIGVQKTAIDSAALKENVALSMADILTFNSSVFVKSHGRATLSTVTFRGTSPGHTQVTWNGMRINTPMLGMTDFSTIPSYFIDRATLLHGTSSVNESSGGLGGLVSLGTVADIPKGPGVKYVQGIGSFRTFDEYARITYGGDNWSVSTRAVYSSSPNDYRYTNHDKKVNIYDDDHNIIGQYHPEEKNRSGSFKDLHLLQEVYYTPCHRDRIGLNAWYAGSNRELPMLTTDYGDESEFENRQREHTFRGVLSWRHSRQKWNSGVRAGYIHSRTAYDYRREVSPGHLATMTRSRNRVNTLYGQADVDYRPADRWYLTVNASVYQHFVRSEDKNIIMQDGDKAVVGYDKGRIELSGSVSAKWQPTDRMGLSAVIREEMYGQTWAPAIPAFFVDCLVSRPGNVTIKASASRNHRFPTLNDLYFLPGGNPELKNESGWTYDAGASFNVAYGGSRGLFPFYVDGSVTWFDSHISNWIIWLPTAKGFFSPRNVKKVHSYGIESRLKLSFEPADGWMFDIGGSYSWTPSVNEGEKMSPADQSVGKQLPYVPKHSASLTGRVTWRSWSFLYKWAHYSERFTMSSNDHTLTGHLPKYFMSNISLEKGLTFRPLDIQLKLAVNNLFNEDYLSVLAHPMPGINFEFFISLTPKFSKARRQTAITH